jgi:disulfide bond formation protein DsbB
MRTLLIAFSLVLGISLAPATHQVTASLAPATVAAAGLDMQQQPPATQAPQVNIEVHRSGGPWYASPVWIAIGAIALVVVILLIVLAARGGGGTTVVRG